MDTRLKYFLAGFVFGAFFPVFALWIEFYRLDLVFSMQNLSQIHDLNPLLYIIDTAPLFLGLFALIGGRNMWVANRLNNELTHRASELKALAKYRQNFLANMSHEIRTPMNGVIGVVEQLRVARLTEPQEELVQIMEESSDNLMDIINNILDLSKLEVGKMSLQEEVTTVDACIRYVKVLFTKITG